MDVFRRYLIKSNPRQIQDTRSQKRLKTLWVLSSAGRASPLQNEGQVIPEDTILARKPLI